VGGGVGGEAIRGSGTVDKGIETHHPLKGYQLEFPADETQNAVEPGRGRGRLVNYIGSKWISRARYPMCVHKGAAETDRPPCRETSLAQRVNIKKRTGNQLRLREARKREEDKTKVTHAQRNKRVGVGDVIRSKSATAFTHGGGGRVRGGVGWTLEEKRPP